MLSGYLPFMYSQKCIRIKRHNIKKITEMLPIIKKRVNFAVAKAARGQKSLRTAAAFGV